MSEDVEAETPWEPDQEVREVDHTRSAGTSHVVGPSRSG